MTVAIDDELVERMLSKMAMSRAIDAVIDHYMKSHPIDGWWHKGEGHEGAQVGAASALRPDDYVAYHYRGCGWVLGKGMALEPVIGDLLGKVTGSTGGKGAGAPHWADLSLGLLGEGATLGSSFVIAGGAAIAIDIRGTDQVAVAAFGDGTSGRGPFHETLLQAAAWRLPLIYICENNHWFVDTAFDEWCPTSLAQRAEGYGIPGVSVDGQDAVAVYEAMSEAVARARAGEGPTLIEANVMRRRGHYVGDMEAYRPADDLADYRDPIDVLGARLAPEVKDRIVEEANAAVQAAYEDALAAPEAGPEILWKDVYAA